MQKFDIQERVVGKVTVGSDKGAEVVWAGRMSERANSENIYFDGSDNFVVLHVGKRGSGKSYGMGAILEAFATGDDSEVATHGDRKAVVLLDPLDIHWPAIIPLESTGPAALKQQYEVAKKWGITPEPVDVRVFMPAGHAWEVDHPGFREYQVPVGEMTAADWALLMGADLVTEPRGRVLDEAFMKVTELGWSPDPSGTLVAAKSDYTVEDLIDCIERDIEIAALYAEATRRSVLQPLRTFSRMPLFQGSAGTPMVDVAREGALSILSLGRLAEDLRTVVATVFVRKLKADRMYASQVRRRLALSPEDDKTVKELQAELALHVPRTVLAIDEAQILMPASGSSMARRALDSFVLEGRNFGLSLWLATQRPKGAISNAAISQIDTFIVNRLSVADDVKAVCNMLQSRLPEKIRLGGREIDMQDLIRSLDVGQALFSSATSDASRLVVGMIRPRLVAHGGEAF